MNSSGTAIIFLFSAVILIIYIGLRILDTSSKSTEAKKSLVQTLDSQNEFNWGKTLLSLGPVLFGFGLVGYLLRNFWDNSDFRLLITILGFALTFLGGTFVKTKATDSSETAESKRLKFIYEPIFMINGILMGALLFSLNGYVNDKFGYLPFGVTEIFGFWFMYIVLISYFAKSGWILSINTVISLFWLSPYLNENLNLVKIFDFQLAASINPLFSILVPTAATVVCGFLYAYHTKQKHYLSSSRYRAFYYLNGLFAFYIAGALIFHAIDQNYDLYYNYGDFRILNDLLIALVTLSFFAIDYVLVRTNKDYDINYLAPIAVTLASVGGFLASLSGYFGYQNYTLGLFFLEVPFTLWVMGDFLRNKSMLSEVLFYTFCSIQLYLISIEPIDFNWFKMLVILGVMIYAGVIHYKNRNFTTYVLVAGILAITFKVIKLWSNSSLDGFVVVMVLGSLFSIYGYYFSFIRKKRSQEYQVTKTDS